MIELTKTWSGERFAKPLFVVTVVLGSFLLFLTQPMVARMALPRVGGAPAVWNSAMLVYQALLLGGYAYAHALARLKPRKQAGVHLALFAVAALWLPIGLSPQLLPPDASPALWVPWFLVASIGPLFFTISTQAPLMQRWYALESARGEPYALYSASNLGSFAGLLSYPLIVEPMLSLRDQSILWTAGYIILVILVAACALTIPGHAAEAPIAKESKAPTARQLAIWIALAAVPSGLMLSTTTHLTTDIVAMPLLWVLPLGLYLLSFVVAFATRRTFTEKVTHHAPLVLLITGGLAFATGSQEPLFSATLGLALLFVVAVALHGEMYRRRPDAQHLTAFYLAMAAGGVLGGIFCALVAPVVFDWAYEHPLLIIAAALLVPQAPLFGWIERFWENQRRSTLFVVPLLALLISVCVEGPLTFFSGWSAILGSVLICLLTVLTIGHRWAFATCLTALMLSYGGWSTLDVSLRSEIRTRSYFGIYTVANNEEGNARGLTHGTTLHGMQNLSPSDRLKPTTYYISRSGVGLAMRSANLLYGDGATIGVVGLGAGTLACYALPDQNWSFFEIDPAIVKIANRSGQFTFLSTCAPHAKILLGDARLTLAQRPAGQMDILALDAFSSDSVPMHLLTREALQLYGKVLRPSGLLLIHISNRYVDLTPVLAAGAATGGWHGLTLHYVPAEHDEKNANTSTWVVLSRDPASLSRLVQATSSQAKWQKLRPRPGFAAWTDDYASILPLLKPGALSHFEFGK